jgi:hypothetical protein
LSWDGDNVCALVGEAGSDDDAQALADLLKRDSSAIAPLLGN